MSLNQLLRVFHDEIEKTGSNSYLICAKSSKGTGEVNGHAGGGQQQI